MRILWLNWKDRRHPLAGGAEVVNEELAKRLAHDGHEVVFLVAAFRGVGVQEKHDGFSIIRVGRRMSVYWQAYKYYKKNLQDSPDIVIDEMNTMPFFAKFYVKQRNILFVHQLCREIWFYEAPFPLSLIGYLLETFYLRLLSTFNFPLATRVVTVSQSTKTDLQRHGFKAENIDIISEGLEMEPLSEEEFAAQPKQDSLDTPMILSVGRVEPMKRTLHIIRAFGLLKKDIPGARLVIVGHIRGSYGKRVREACRKSAFAKDITITGVVTPEKKVELMREATVLAMASVKEGWGLVVTEANSQGTPAVVYDADGLRDSVRHGETGVICAKNTPNHLALSIEGLLKDPANYERIRENAWKWSKEITFDNSYRQFVEILNHV